MATVCAYSCKGSRRMNSRLPEEIKALDQWVCVKADEKIPRDARGYPASCSDPETWCSYGRANLSINGYVVSRFSDIGFVFNDNGIVGIDIDAGFENGLMTPLCADIMNACKSYTEVSRSGRGVHILVRGDIPFKGRNNRAGVEMYKAGRFFIMTGDVCVFPKIITNQEALDYIVETYFPDARESHDGRVSTKFYIPQWKAPEAGKMPLSPHYTPVGPGARNQSLTSLAGSMWNMGYSKDQIYRELTKANRQACRPPLADTEVRSICRSITIYRR